MMMTTAIQMIAKMMAMPTTVGSEDDDEDELLELRVSIYTVYYTIYYTI